MPQSKVLIEDFIESKTIKALEIFIASDEEKKISDAADTLAKTFGSSSKNFSKVSSDEATKLVQSFKNNLTLLIQKTWVEKTDIELKEQVLYQLEQLFSTKQKSWKNSYALFIEILHNAVYLMFGQKTDKDEFCEYALRLDPEFGVFWWYVSNLPHTAEWKEEKCRLAILLGMYFLANY